MPIYEYWCLECQKTFEKLVRSSLTPGIKCLRCGGEKVEKIISLFSTRNSSTGNPSTGVCPTGTCPLSWQ